MILVEFIGFLTYMTRFKANMTLFMEKYTNENGINFAGSCFVYIKKSVVLLMIVTTNLPNGCVKVIVLFCCPSCTAELDRDINGARNILLRYLTVTSKEPVYAGAGTYPLGPS